METQRIPEFGIKRENEERRDGGCAVVFDPIRRRYAVGKRDRDGLLLLFSGGVEPDEDIREGILREVREEGGLYDVEYTEKIGEALTHYHNSNKNVDRVAHATCFLIILKSAALVPTQLEAHEKFLLAWATAEEILACWRERNQNEDYSHWIYFFEKAAVRVQEILSEQTLAES
ncbi:MAG: NUDIX domain-containing protein [Candidatus Paceibacterota bacterium]|jgi:8-oxo-dGTP pyrophosphatase MutT (NUDIX family)